MDCDPVREYGDRLAVVTVTRTAAPELDRFVRSLRLATARPARVVVADTVGAAVPVGVEVVRIGEDVGRAAAINRAVAALEPEVGWMALADPAVQWCPDALDALLEVAARHPRAAVLGPVLRDARGRPAASSGPWPSVADALRGRVPAGCVPIGPEPNSSDPNSSDPNSSDPDSSDPDSSDPDSSDPDRSDPGPVGWLSATCLLVRRLAWDSVGGFDPRYLGACDDVDLGDRLGRAGWLAVHVPDVEVRVDAGVGAGGILEAPAAGVRRFVRDRSGAPIRGLLALAARVH